MTSPANWIRSRTYTSHGPCQERTLHGWLSSSGWRGGARFSQPRDPSSSPGVVDGGAGAGTGAVNGVLVPVAGIEPATSLLQVRCYYLLSYAGKFLSLHHCLFSSEIFGVSSSDIFRSGHISIRLVVPWITASSTIERFNWRWSVRSGPRSAVD